MDTGPQVSGFDDLKGSIQAANKRTRAPHKLKSLHLASLAESARDILFRIRFKPFFAVEYLSQSGVKLSGHSAEEMSADVRLLENVLITTDQPDLKSYLDHPESIPNDLQLICKNRDGEKVWLDCLLAHLVDDQGVVFGVEGVARDVSKQRQPGSDYILRERRYFELFESARGCVVITNAAGLVIHANQTAVKVLGFDNLEQLIGYPAIELYAVPERRLEIIEVLRKEGSLVDFEVELKRRDGRRIWVRCSARMYRDASGNPVRLETVFTDETEGHKKAVELAESEARYKLLFDLSPQAVVIHANGTILFANPRAAKLIGAGAPEELEGRSAIEFVHKDDRPAAVERIKRILATGETAPTMEERFIRLDGKVIDVEVTARPLEFKGLSAVMAVISDISERKLWESELQSRRWELETIFNSAPVAMVLIDEDRRIIRMNNAAVEFTKFDKKSASGLQLGEALRCLEATEEMGHCGLGETCNKCGIRNTVLNTLETGCPFYKVECELPVKNKDQAYTRHLLISTAVVRTNGTRQVLVCLDDVTARHQMQAELRDSRERYRQMFDALRSGVLVCELDARSNDFRIVDINNAAARMEHRPKGSFLRTWLTDAFPRIEESGILDVIHRVNRTGTPEFIPATKLKFDRSVGWREFYIYRLPIGHTVVVYNDVTRESEALIAQRESEKRYRELLENSPESIVIVQDTRISFFNKAFLQLTGVDADKLQNLPLINLLDDRDCELFLERHRKRLTGQELSRSCELRLIQADGTLRWIEMSGARILWNDGPAVLNFIKDITSEVELRSELEETKSLFLRLLALSSDPICITVGWDKLLAANESYQEWFGIQVPEGKMIEFDPLASVAPECHSLFLEQSTRELNQPHQSANYEIIVKRADGRTVEVEVSDTSFVKSDVEVTLRIFRDISKRKNLEKQLLHSQKMEAIGRLAGGMAHDFNNLLTVILGHCELAVSMAPEQDPIRQSLELVIQSSERAAALTKQLLAFSRKQNLEPRIVNVNALIAGLRKMLARVIGEDLHLNVQLSHQAKSVFIDPNQLEQVLMNLIVNARDAMPSGGEVTVKTENVRREEVDAQLEEDRNSPEWVVISVSDSGIGMSKEIQSRIFEPFFTTKEEGRGTGLGLATAYGIINQSGGELSVESIEGVGSTFKIYLPAASDAQRTEPLLSENLTSKQLKGTETVLIAEDEKSVRDLAAQILRARGYQVEVTANGAEALEIIRSGDQRIDLVITDVIMPKMNGLELVKAIESHYPGTRVILMSGYTSDHAELQSILDQGYKLIRKPFKPSAFLKSVREVLDEEVKR